MPIEYSVVSMTPDELATERAVYGGLADTVRALADASVRTTLPPAEVEAVREELDRLAERLAADRILGAFGVSVTTEGEVGGHGNAVVGLRNPVAPPLVIERDQDRVRSEFTL